ncbi:hypothetical protein ACFLXY_00325 [Chloroflexota bacterium]
MLYLPTTTLPREDKFDAVQHVVDVTGCDHTGIHSTYPCGVSYPDAIGPDTMGI